MELPAKNVLSPIFWCQELTLFFCLSVFCGTLIAKKKMVFVCVWKKCIVATEKLTPQTCECAVVDHQFLMNGSPLISSFCLFFRLIAVSVYFFTCPLALFISRSLSFVASQFSSFLLVGKRARTQTLQNKTNITSKKIQKLRKIHCPGRQKTTTPLENKKISVFVCETKVGNMDPAAALACCLVAINILVLPASEPSL